MIATSKGFVRFLDGSTHINGGNYEVTEDSKSYFLLMSDHYLFDSIDISSLDIKSRRDFLKAPLNNKFWK